MSFHTNAIYRMKNPIQNYAWGSTTAFVELYGLQNLDAQPQAEIWMGAHPNGCSELISVDNQSIRLDQFIAQAPQAVLGDAFHSYGELPYLFKVLAAASPLSIQVHPDKASSEAGFHRENEQGIAIAAPNRNFKDPNHKPELVYALTEYRALNGFREFSEIVALLNGLDIPALNEQISQFCSDQTPETLKTLFAASLQLIDQAKQDSIELLLKTAKTRSESAYKEICRLADFYPDDMGLFSPLLLNVVVLQPGEAMFLYASTPHSYLQGVGLEAMASSDNVLRAGLTPKYIDVEALIENVDFVAKPASELRMVPFVIGPIREYPIPVSDFTFTLVDLSSEGLENQTATALILFCVDGSAQVSFPGGILQLNKGESCFVSADVKQFNISGTGQLVQIGSR